MNKSFNTQTLASLNTLIHLPKNYDETKTYPVILFLHGSGERGESVEDLNKIKSNWPLAYQAASPYEFIVVAPQCPHSSYWPILVNNLNDLLDQVIKSYRIDETRIYLTGLSMGGYGAWYLAFAYPQRFAAVAPVCGGGIPSSAKTLANTPIWAFHGVKDDVVPVNETTDLTSKITDAGGNVKVTLYDDVGHNAWDYAYNDQELYEWFLSHRLNK